MGWLGVGLILDEFGIQREDGKIDYQVDLKEDRQIPSHGWPKDTIRWQTYTRRDNEKRQIPSQG